MNTNRKVLLVVNPISGGIDKNSIIDLLRSIFSHEKEKLSIYRTSGKNDKEQLTSIIKEFQPHRILIAGGDGTIKLIAEIIKEKPIPLGLFPVGSANGLAENLRLPSQLEELAAIALGEHFVSLDCLVVNNELCLHISDIGLNAELIKNYEEGNVRGKLGYIIQSIPTLIRSNFPFSFDISIGEKKYHRKGVLLAIANAQKYGTGATINPKGVLNDGLFEILCFKKFDLQEILKTFQEDVKPSEDFLEIFPASQARIECEKHLPFQIDGEYRGEVNSVEVHVLSHQIQMAAPAHFI